MPSVNATLVKQVMIVHFNDDGSDVATVRLISEIRKDGITKIGAPVEKKWTKAQAGAAGVTAPQNTAFLAAAETLEGDHQTSLLG